MTVLGLSYYLEKDGKHKGYDFEVFVRRNGFFKISDNASKYPSFLDIFIKI